MPKRITKKEAKEYLEILTNQFGKKEFGNYVQMSRLAADTAKTNIVKEAIGHIADSLILAMKRQGMKPVKGSEKVLITEPSTTIPIYNRTMIGARLESVFDVSPEGFLAFCSYWVTEHLQLRQAAESDRDAWRAKHGELYSLIFNTRTLRGVRKIIRDREKAEADRW